MKEHFAIVLMVVALVVLVGMLQQSNKPKPQPEIVKGHIICPRCHACIGHVETLVTTTTKTDAREVIER